MQMTEKILIYC